MNAKSLKGYVMVVFSGLVVLAAVLLIVLQWGNTSAFSAYGKNYGDNAPGGINTALLMLGSAAGGIVLAVMLWMLYRGIRELRAGWKKDDARRTRKRIGDLEKSRASEPSKPSGAE